MHPTMTEDDPKHEQMSADSAHLTMADVFDLGQKAADLGQRAKEIKQHIRALGDPRELEKIEQRDARRLARLEEAFAFKQAYYSQRAAESKDQVASEAQATQALKSKLTGQRSASNSLPSKATASRPSRVHEAEAPNEDGDDKLFEDGAGNSVEANDEEKTYEHLLKTQ
jgi:hypothetical protein